MNVLSLFDGMSCGRVALDRAEIPVTKYYASEIDKHATSISEKNYPDIIRLGDVTKWREWDIDWGCIDLLTAGFPCQAWSVAGKQKGCNDPRGVLVYELLNILNEIKKLNPEVDFLFENVRMKKDFLEFMNGVFGCEPILINSSLVSAQNRHRYYWTSWDVPQPKVEEIYLKDIVHETLGEDFNLCDFKIPFDKTLQILDKEVEKGKVGYSREDVQSDPVYNVHGEEVIICEEDENGQYLFGCITPDRVNKRQNGQRFNDGNKFYTLTAQDRHGILVDGYIRKLTPTEYERLQTLQDGYTEGVSNSQRYKMLGNGWTVDVIAYILKERYC